MGQKVNPTCLRLHPENKHFDSCWFSEKQYAHSIHKNLNVEAYYNAILKQIQYPSASFFLEAAPRKCKVSVLFLNPAQLRQQAFKQFDNITSRNKGARGGTLFSTKRKTTRFSGLVKREGGVFGPSFPLPLPLTPSFLQNLKNKDLLLYSRREHLNPSVFSVFSLEKTNIKSSKTTTKEILFPLENRSQKRDQNLSRSALLHVEKDGLQRERTPPFLAQQVAQEKVRALNRQVDQESKRRSSTFARRGMWSSVIGLAIWRYFVERGGGQNLLSSTSRFLLLQAFFSFLKVGERNHLYNGGSKGALSQSEKTPSRGDSFDSFGPLLDGGQKSTPSPRPLYSRREHLLLKSLGTNKKQIPDSQDSHGFFTNERLTKSANQTNKQDSGLFSNLRKSSIYAYHIESIISERLKSSCRLSFFKARDVAQNAIFVAEEIVYQLQRRNTFRQIKTRFLQELGCKSAIKGIRVTCVGRIGGRAKKAQRARGESFKMGQTSLHLFDSKLSFASKTALTPFGAVGVKVWICWK